MVDSVGQLELFHCRLDELLKVVARFWRELTAKAERDDLAMTRWKSGEDLSELETQQFSQFESWRESRAYWWDREKPEVGAESFRDFNGRHPTPEIRIAFIRCREAIGYSSAGEVPRSALNVFERAVEDYARMMKCRVEMDWPRPRIDTILRDILACQYYFELRELQEIVDLTETEQEWWRGTSKPTVEPAEVQSRGKTSLDARDEWIYGDALNLNQTWAAIKHSLNSVQCPLHGWKEIRTNEGVKAAAHRYAKRKQLSLPPDRKVK